MKNIKFITLYLLASVAVIFLSSPIGAATYNPVRSSADYAVADEVRNLGGYSGDGSGGSYPYGRKSTDYACVDSVGGGIFSDPANPPSSANYNAVEGSLANNADDNDGDNLIDSEELFNYGTDPGKSDTEGDGMRDGVEVHYGLNPLVNDAADDLDSDGMPNGWEVDYCGYSMADGVDPSVDDAQDDNDSDNWSNICEYQYYNITSDASDPTDSNSGGQAIPFHDGWNLMGVSSDVCYYIVEPSEAEKQRIPATNYVAITDSDEDGNVDIDDLLHDMGIAAYVDEITAWCPNTGSGQNESKKYERGQIRPPNNLDYITGGFGYWTKANTACTWKLNTYHRLKSIGGTDETPMYAGGNLVSDLFAKVCYRRIPTDLLPEFGSDEVAQVEAAESYLHDYIIGRITKNGGSPLSAGDVEEMVAVDRKGAHSYFYGYPDSFQTLKYVGPGMGLWIKMKEGLSDVEFNFPSE